MKATPAPDQREAWRRNAVRAAAAKAGFERQLRAAFTIDEDLPEPIADALRRAEEAIANVQEATAK